jgi:hypothetical protein
MTHNENNSRKPSRHVHLERQDAFINAGNSQIKVSRVPKEIPILTYSIGHQREDHESGKTFFAPYVRHQDLPAVIAALQAEYDRNEASISATKARIEQEFAEGKQEADSWRRDKDHKGLRRLHKEGARQVQGRDLRPKVDSSKEREKNRRTFMGGGQGGEGGEGGQQS